jgi:3-deoxy-manno-octulosonate cytidylyltransferase (CMP-KDO synthetase)
MHEELKINTMTKKILGIIPARYASTRFPGKPLADIGGKIMVQRVYEQASKELDCVYVATDDERIEKAIAAFGGKVVMTSVDHTSGTDRCAEALLKIQTIEGTTFEAVVNIQGDEPFISPKQIASVAKCFKDSSTQLATLVKEITNTEDLFNSNKPKVVVSNTKNALYFSRSPIPYLRGEEEAQWVKKHKYYNHIGLYGYRADVLLEITQLAIGQLEAAESLEQLRWLENGYSIRVEETDEESHGIDTPEDLERLLKLGLI